MTNPGMPRPRGDQAPPARRVWALWDAGDLLSLHATRQGARDAANAHLFALGPLAPDQHDECRHAIQIVTTTIET